MVGILESELSRFHAQTSYCDAIRIGEGGRVGAGHTDRSGRQEDWRQDGPINNDSLADLTSVTSGKAPSPAIKFSISFAALSCLVGGGTTMCRSEVGKYDGWSKPQERRLTLAASCCCSSSSCSCWLFFFCARALTCQRST